MGDGDPIAKDFEVCSEAISSPTCAARRRADLEPRLELDAIVTNQARGERFGSDMGGGYRVSCAA
jgi:hypothetical protein